MSIKQRIKRAVGEHRIAAVQRALAPARMAPLRQAIRNNGWTPNDFQMTDHAAATHFANEVPLDEFSRTTVRFFHEYKIRFLRESLTDRFISTSEFLEIGDPDGLLLKALGKSELSITDDPRCADQIRRNGLTALVGRGERIEAPDKSRDVVMAFETLEHSLNPVSFLGEMCRVSRQKVAISVPGVTRTIIHPRVRGTRVGEEHVFEFCPEDLLRLATHLPLRVSVYQRMPVFASPRNPLHWAYYNLRRNREVFAGCFRAFDFYVFDVVNEDQGVEQAVSAALY
jgi:Methyltransferase domain